MSAVSAAYVGTYAAAIQTVGWSQLVKYVQNGVPDINPDEAKVAKPATKVGAKLPLILGVIRAGAFRTWVAQYPAFEECCRATERVQSHTLIWTPLFLVAATDCAFRGGLRVLVGVSWIVLVSRQALRCARRGAGSSTQCIR